MAHQSEVETEQPVDKAYNFNRDPAWERVALSYEAIIERIAIKFCASDESLREDVMQEARIALRTVTLEKIHGFAAFTAGTLDDEQWSKMVDRYCRNVIRNSILSYLDSYPKGNWYVGRNRTVKNKRTGAAVRVYLPPRFSSLDQLTEEFGIQVDESGAISWTDPSDDGISRRYNLSDDE